MKKRLCFILVCICAFCAVVMTGCGKDKAASEKMPEFASEDARYAVSVEDKTVYVYAKAADAEQNGYIVSRELEASTAEDFSAPLSLLSCVPKEDIWVYSFEKPANDPLDSLYVKPTVLTASEEIPAYTAELPSVDYEKGFDAIIVDCERELLLDEEPWFTVTSLSLIEEGTLSGSMDLKVFFENDGHGDVLPQNPVLAIGDASYTGSSDVETDENGDFPSGVFTFVIPLNTKIESVSLTVSEALVKVEGGREIVKVK